MRHSGDHTRRIAHSDMDKIDRGPIHMDQIDQEQTPAKDQNCEPTGSGTP